VTIPNNDCSTSLEACASPTDAAHTGRQIRLTSVADQTDKQASTKSALRRAQCTYVSQAHHPFPVQLARWPYLESNVHESTGLRNFAGASRTRVKQLYPHAQSPARSVAVPPCHFEPTSVDLWNRVPEAHSRHRFTRLTVAVAHSNARPPFINLLCRLVHGMPSHVGERLAPRRKDMSTLARIRHCRGHGAVWLR